MDTRNSGGAAYQHHFFNLSGLQFGIGQRLLAGCYGALNDGLNQLLKLLPRDGSPVTLALRQVNINMGLRVEGESNLGLDHGFTQGLNGFSVTAKIEIQITGNVVQGNGEQEVVNVIAAQMGVAISGQHFENALVQLENGNIKGTAAQIIDGHNAIMLFVEAVSQ